MSSKRFCNDDISSDSTDDLTEIYFSSSSHDRSSVGSIPWAEDAIKQNESDWDQLEQMFYGEQDLPDNKELREEILDWQRAFPHLRVNGGKLNLPSLSRINLAQNLNKTEEIVFAEPINAIKKESHNNNKEYINVTKLLEKNLRIKSVPMLTKRRQIWHDIGQNNQNLYDQDKSIQRNPKKSILSNKNFHRKIFQSSNSTNSLINNNNDHKIPMNTSSSARILRMPPIDNYFLPQRNQHLTQIFVEPRHENRTKPKSTMILPTISVLDDSSGRSISAAINQRTSHSQYLPNSASKFKNI